MRFTGDHVELVPLLAEHAAPLFEAARGHAAAFSLTSVPDTLEGMHRYVATALALQARNAAVPFATVRRSDARIVGSTRFANLEFWQWPEGSGSQRPSGVPDAVEIGWTWLTPAAQRTALNTEAKLLLLTHAFEVWRVHRVTLKTDVRNARSRANIERIGGTLDGILRAHMPAADGGIRTSAVYSLLAGEWPALRDRLRLRLH